MLLLPGKFKLVIVYYNSKLKGYEKFRGPLKRNTKGAILCVGKGKATTFALKDVENHGILYITPGTEVLINL